MPVARRPVVIFVVRWVVTLALLGGLAYGVRQLFTTARLRGAQEAADDAARSHGPRPRAATTTSAPAGAASTAPVATTTTQPLGISEPVTPSAIEASDTERDQPDSCGRPVHYDVANLVDGNVATAWRVAGDGEGATVTLTLPGRIHLTQVGLVPGYAKVDLCSNFDRFTQLRRIVSVTWHFDGEVSLPQTFKDRPEMQTLPVDVTTSTVTIEVRSTTSDPRLDATAISEVQLLGEPVA